MASTPKPLNTQTLITKPPFQPFELEHLMARAGFDRVQMYGDFDRSPVVAGCPALIVVAGTSG